VGDSTNLEILVTFEMTIVVADVEDDLEEEEEAFQEALSHAEIINTL
jgi:hypothetical protein